MNPSLSYKNWFKHLQVLSPQEGVVYVGAGTGLSLLNYINDSVKSVILIEAEESYITRLEQLANLNNNWTFVNATVGSKAEKSTFYHLSNIAESSLVAPEYLNDIWRNLNILEERAVEISPLADVLDKAVLDSKNFNWLVIDCFPALPILQGAGQYNSSWEVISARVIVDESICAEQGATKREVDNYLSLLGYRCVSVEEERQPAIAKALYVRDWRYLEKQIAEQAKAVSELQGQNTQLSQQLTQAKAEQEKQIAEQAKAVSELQGQNTQLNQKLTMEDNGLNNRIAFGEKIRLVGRITGDNNRITIGNAKHDSTVDIHVYGSNNNITIGESFQMKNLVIRCGNHVLAHNTNLTIGDNFSIEIGSKILIYNSGNQLTIGDNCMFSNNITIRAGESPHLIFDLDTGEYLDISEGIYIGNHVWIGENVYITKKVTVPNECIVAACSVVTKRFNEEHCVLAGNPAKIVKRNVVWARNGGLLQRGSLSDLNYRKYLIKYPKLQE